MRLLRRAGLVHDLGRLGVSNAIWDKRGPIGAGEWERLRFQPYLTERMLRQSPALAPLARIAVQHRERLDGSGYPQGLTGSGITTFARIVAAADAYQAMREPRPHRPALPAEEAAAELRADVKAGRYDADAAEAVLGAAGHRVQRRREGPAGLTPREVEVLKLLARGFSNKEIAEQLTISPTDPQPAGPAAPARPHQPGMFFDTLFDNTDLFVDAFRTTVSLAVVTGVLCLLGGTVLATMRVSPVPVLRAAGTVYVNISATRR